MSQKDYYQFNIDFMGNYIRGYKLTETEDFIAIEFPEIKCDPTFNIQPADNKIFLSKNTIAYYFKIS